MFNLNATALVFFFHRTDKGTAATLVSVEERSIKSLIFRTIVRFI